MYMKLMLGEGGMWYTCVLCINSLHCEGGHVDSLHCERMYWIFCCVPFTSANTYMYKTVWQLLLPRCLLCHGMVPKFSAIKAVSMHFSRLDVSIETESVSRYTGVRFVSHYFMVEVLFWFVRCAACSKVEIGGTTNSFLLKMFCNNRINTSVHCT